MVESLKKVLMERDGLTSSEADEQISDAQERVMDGENPEEILHDEFGLEPDYIFDLIP
jgi:hypothetical protein